MSFTSSCSMSRWTAAPTACARTRTGSSRTRASARPWEAVDGPNSGDRPVGLTDTLTRGRAPQGSHSSRSSDGHADVSSTSAASIAPTRRVAPPAFRDGLRRGRRPCTLRRPPDRWPRQRLAWRPTGDSCRAIRMIPARATAEIRAPSGTSSDVAPKPSTRGTSTPSKYSVMCRSTSASPRQAGRTSIKRKSCVLKLGCDIAQSRIRSLQRPRWKSRARSEAPASVIWRASSCTSRSDGAVTAARSSTIHPDRWDRPR